MSKLSTLWDNYKLDNLEKIFKFFSFIKIENIKAVDISSIIEYAYHKLLGILHLRTSLSFFYNKYKLNYGMVKIILANFPYTYSWFLAIF
jgi:hypothetical protein